MKYVCDAFVFAGAAKGIIVPVTAIFSGGVYGAGAFLAGAIVVSTILFVQTYFWEMYYDADERV